MNLKIKEKHWELTILNKGKIAALNIWLQDGRQDDAQCYVFFDQNYYCLFPGEERKITADWENAHASERSQEIGGWNTQSVIISR